MFGIESAVFAALGGFFGGWLDDSLGSRNALLISIGGTALFFALALTHGAGSHFLVLAFDRAGASAALPVAVLQHLAASFSISLLSDADGAVHRRGLRQQPHA